MFDNPLYIVEQFTGFKDSDGTDIYVGDLLKASIDTSFRGESPSVVEKLFTAKRKEKEMGFEIRGEGSYAGVPRKEWLRCKVIGNTHVFFEIVLDFWEA